LLERHRSIRGTLTSKVKESLFTIFGENALPPINVNASGAEINRWKSTPNVKRCYENLFRPMSEDTIVSYMARILERLWPDSTTASQAQMAYAIGVCQVVLNPNNKHIRITKKVIKKKLQENLVSFATFCK
jgi:hypothetical protein